MLAVPCGRVRPVLLPALLLLVPLSTASAQEAAPLPRVGAEVDAHEARYFGLFQGFGAVERVRLTREGAGVRAEIERQARPDTAVALTAQQVSLLEAYVTSFEDEATVRTLDLAPLSGLFRYAVRVQPGLRVGVTLTGGGRVDGTLLYADDGALVLALTDAPFQWDHLGDRHALALAWHEVAEVETQLTRVADRSRRIVMTIGVAGTNLLLGTGAVLSREGDVLSALSAATNVVASGAMLFGPQTSRAALWIGGDPKRGAALAARWSQASAVEHRAAFWTMSAPEIVALARGAAARPQSTESPRVVAGSRPRFHFAIGGLVLTPRETPVEGQYATGTGLESIEPVRDPGGAFVVDLSYEFVRRLRVGLSASASTPAAGDDWTGQLSTRSVAPYVEFVAVAPQPSLRTLTGRFELAVGAGVAMG